METSQEGRKRSKFVGLDQGIDPRPVRKIKILGEVVIDRGGKPA